MENAPTLAAGRELSNRERLCALLRASPLSDYELLTHLDLFITRQVLSRMVFFNDLYKTLIPLNGSILYFGCRAGNDLALLGNLRGMYEPYNYTRKIVGFDTFEGLPELADRRAESGAATTGTWAMPTNYVDYLNQVLDCHEAESPIQHIRKYDIRKGDVLLTLPSYLAEFPHTLVSMAVVDLGAYEPSFAVLENLKPHLVKGAFLVFTALNADLFPGDTLALRDAFGLNTLPIRRLPNTSHLCYCVVE